jgi:hypothetical protein
MIARTVCVTACLVACSLLVHPSRVAAADSASDVKVEIVGVQVAKPLPQPKSKAKSENQMQMSSLFGGPGTQVHLFVTDAKRIVLALDDKESKVALADDKGNDLGEDKAAKGNRFSFGSNPLSDR